MVKLDASDPKWVELIRNINIIKYLDGNEILEMQKIIDITEYSKSEKIIEEGSISPYFYAVLDGIVTVRVNEKNGKDIYICSIGKNEIFGEAGLFINVKRTANVIALDKSIVAAIDRRKFLDFIQKNPKGGLKVLMLIIYSLLSKLREANQDLAVERKYNFNQADVDKLLGELFE